MNEDKGTCPICGKPNGCAVVAHKDPAACWCMSTKVPEGLLALIPKDKRGHSCVCEQCVKHYIESPNLD